MPTHRAASRELLYIYPVRSTSAGDCLERRAECGVRGLSGCAVPRWMDGFVFALGAALLG